jgi:prophage DNA circulation protein
MEEHVRKLEAQLKDSFKGQIDSLAVVKENMEMTEKMRELERKNALYSDRLKEYDEIAKRQSDEADKKDAIIKTLKAENEAVRMNVKGLEEKVKQLSHDNQTFLQKIFDMKSEQAEIFNQANNMYLEA